MSINFQINLIQTDSKMADNIKQDSNISGKSRAISLETNQHTSINGRELQAILHVSIFMLKTRKIRKNCSDKYENFKIYTSQTRLSSRSNPHAIYANFTHQLGIFSIYSLWKLQRKVLIKN